MATAPSPVFDLTASGHWDEHSTLLLTDPITTPLDHGYNEMDRLLELLPSPVGLDQGLDIGLGSIMNSNSNNNNDDWSWLNEGNF